MTSQLVGFHEQAREAGQDNAFQLILVSGDSDAETMVDYVRKSDIGFPAVRFDSMDEEEVASLIGNPGELPLPAVKVVSPDGEQLSIDVDEALDMVGASLSED